MVSDAHDQKYRSTPNPSLETHNPSSSSNALSELTLAHRRLTHLLENSQSRALSLSHQLSISQSELKIADGRVEVAETREEEMWNKLQGIEVQLMEEKEGRRREGEEKKVLELALKEAVGRLGGQEEVVAAEEKEDMEILANEHNDDNSTAIIRPIESPTSEELNEVSDSVPNSSTSTEGTICPTCSFPRTANNASKPISNSTCLPPSTPSNILLGLQGIRRLFTDFSSSLSTKEIMISELEHEMERLKGELELWKELEAEERRRRVESVDEMEKMKESDEGAAKVVERYM